MQYYTSDLHLGHDGLAKRRGFRDADEMNQFLIQQINTHVTRNDELWILGDFSYRISKEEARKLLRQIVCRNKHLIRGNHDKNWTVKDGWESVETYHELKTEQGKLILFHYPMLAWDGKNRESWDLHGHIHSDGQVNLQNARQGIRRFDVGADANNFCPVTIDDILAKMTNGGRETEKYSMWIKWSDEDNRYIATMPDLTGCMADGRTYEEAVANAQEVIAGWLEAEEEDVRDTGLDAARYPNGRYK